MLQVVFATAVTKPGHGNIAPLAIGFTLFASAFVGEGIFHHRRPGCTAQVLLAFCHAAQRPVLELTELLRTDAGGPSTGAALNPARVLGPAMVFHW